VCYKSRNIHVEDRYYKILFEEGKVSAVQSGEQICKTKMVICAPSYAIKTGLGSKVKPVGKVIRCICIMDHPIPGTGSKGKECPSVQIIIP